MGTLHSVDGSCVVCIFFSSLMSVLASLTKTLSCHLFVAFGRHTVVSTPRSRSIQGEVTRGIDWPSLLSFFALRIRQRSDGRGEEERSWGHAAKERETARRRDIHGAGCCSEPLRSKKRRQSQGIATVCVRTPWRSPGSADISRSSRRHVRMVRDPHDVRWGAMKRHLMSEGTTRRRRARRRERGTREPARRRDTISTRACSALERSASGKRMSLRVES